MAKLPVGYRSDNMQAWANRVRPIRVVYFFDRIEVLSMEDITPDEEAFLNANSGKTTDIHLHGHWYGRRWRQEQCNIWPYRQKWIIYQARQPALALLGRLQNQLLVNYVEHAINLIFATRGQRHHAFQFIGAHHIMRNRRRHRTSWCIGSKGSSRYTSRRTTDHFDNDVSTPARVTIVQATYQDKPCAWTSASNTVHHESRTLEPPYVKRTGIRHAGDLESYDHQQYWRTRFIFADIDSRKLGRVYARHFGGDREDWEAIGNWVKRTYGTNKGRIYVDPDAVRDPVVDDMVSIQSVVDEFRIRHSIRIDYLLTYADVDHLLPLNEIGTSCDLRTVHVENRDHLKSPSRSSSLSLKATSRPADDRPAGGRVKHTAATPTPLRTAPSTTSQPRSRSPPAPAPRATRPTPTSQPHKRNATMANEQNSSPLRTRRSGVIGTYEKATADFIAGRWGHDRDDEFRPAGEVDHDEAGNRDGDLTGTYDRADRRRDLDQDRSPAMRPGTQVRKRR